MEIIAKEPPGQFQPNWNKKGFIFVEMKDHAKHDDSEIRELFKNIS